ncbi:hypothetical protein LOTGIDRAFT_168882 [Lottia gigantea]|uniref:Uncharacterized protein n=1 Tax=Lottia gigantea TaxID=225164 RepID=V3Z075_LOTGI|nr:hypothetical protein LOTGIDRAFT_168882 [Lottia gigantea]ESO83838.1 hypothetical protein LOTGIDRAFT_168882 [Lottia gigantea]
MDCNLVSSPTYQNLYTSRRRPPPPPPLLSPDDKPPALPPRNYRKPLNDPPSNKTPGAGGEESVDNTKLDFKSLMNQWEGSPREDSYAADLRRQARRFSEQQPNSTNMSILHSKTKINFSQSYKREPVLVHQATPPQNTNSSFEEKTTVTSPVLEQPMVVEEGNKENKAPSTPSNQPMSDEEMKTPPRVDRSISELSLPSPPIHYGTLEGDHSELPPPPPEVLEEAEKDDQISDRVCIFWERLF